MIFVPGLLEEITAHAQAEYPNEACGLIAGPAGYGHELYRAVNSAPDPANHFAIDNSTLARQVELADRGWVVSAIYHSHPHGPEVPSAEDVSQALYPEAIYIICALARRSHPVLRGFRIANTRAWEVRLLQAFDNRLTIE